MILPTGESRTESTGKGIAECVPAGTSVATALTIVSTQTATSKLIKSPPQKYLSSKNSCSSFATIMLPKENDASGQNLVVSDPLPNHPDPRNKKQKPQTLTPRQPVAPTRTEEPNEDKTVENVKSVTSECIKGAKFFQNFTPTQRNCLLADLAAAETARAAAVQRSTHDDHARAWKRWNEYCNKTGLTGDIFLTDLTRNKQTNIFSCFAAADREGKFSRPCDAPLAAGTVKTTVNNVAAKFRSQGHPNPTRDEDGILDWKLARQY
jgi:hypothetical protein